MLISWQNLKLSASDNALFSCSVYKVKHSKYLIFKEGRCNIMILFFKKNSLLRSINNSLSSLSPYNKIISFLIYIILPGKWIDKSFCKVVYQSILIHLAYVSCFILIFQPIKFFLIPWMKFFIPFWKSVLGNS